jgi:hypothetical protein
MCLQRKMGLNCRMSAEGRFIQGQHEVSSRVKSQVANAESNTGTVQRDDRRCRP